MSGAARSTSRTGALALAVAVFATGCGETEEIEIEIGFRGEARSNAFLAAERALDAWGREARSLGSFEVPDEDVAFVLVGADALAVESPETAATRAWVADGGHLVLTLFGAARPDFPMYRELGAHALLEPLGVAPSELPATRDDSLAAAYDDWDVGYGRAPGRGLLGGITAEFANTGLVELDDQLAIEPDARLRRTASGDLFGVSFPIEAGRMTVLASGSFASNHGLGRRDNPDLLHELVELSRPGEVRFVAASDQTLISLLWERAAHFVVGGIALIVAWLWRATRRFGPPVVPPGRERHAFGDHVVAAGRFLWRRSGPQAVVDPLRRRVLRAVARAVPDASEEDRVVDALRERSGFERARVRAALFGAVPNDSDSMVAMVRDLHTLERAHD